MYELAERPCGTTVPMMLARQMYTNKLIAKRIELNSSMKRVNGLEAVCDMDEYAARVKEVFRKKRGP